MEIYSVSEVNDAIKGKIEADQTFSRICVRGEISNYAVKNGNHYFSLKDEGSVLKCVIFKNNASHLTFVPQNSLLVKATGRIAVFKAGGVYQLQVFKLEDEGQGALWLAFEETRKRLEEEGLFDKSHKKPIPKFPKQVVLITSAEGAAVHDMTQILGQRWPLCEVMIMPVSVQGEKAPEEIAAALRWASDNVDADLIITGRGGGSIEDLNAFNQEIVARAIYDCRIPVISAVGHETNETIADFVADLRAATPSHAAEHAVQDQRAISEMLNQLNKRLQHSVELKLSEQQARLKNLEEKILPAPEAYLHNRQMSLDTLESNMIAAIRLQLGNGQKELSRLSTCLMPVVQKRINLEQRKLTEISARIESAAHLKEEREKKRVSSLAAALDALSPLRVLGRGYAIGRKEDGAVIQSVNDCVPEMPFCLRLKDGEVDCQVKEVRQT